MRKIALIVIDVQNDFIDGSLAVPEGAEVIAPIAEIADNVDLVVLTQDWHAAGHKSFASNHVDAAPFSLITMPYGEQVLWPDHCVQGTVGAALNLPDEVLNAAELIIRKGTNPDIDSYSAFTENDKVTSTGLEAWLRAKGVDTVIVAGLALDYCVAFSALDASAAGFRVIVPLDACRGIDAHGCEAQIAAMRSAGVEVVDSLAQAPVPDHEV